MNAHFMVYSKRIRADEQLRRCFRKNQTTQKLVGGCARSVLRLRLSFGIAAAEAATSAAAYRRCVCVMLYRAVQIEQIAYMRNDATNSSMACFQ